MQATLSNDPSDVQPAPAPSSPTPSPPVEPLRIDGDAFATRFNKIVARVPDWSIDNIQQIFTTEPCAGDWTSAAGGAGGGNFDVRTNGEPGQVWHDVIGFPTTAYASAAVDRLVENLACTDVAWRTQPIAQTGAVLASSTQGLIWIHQHRNELSTLNAVTDDGPPPLAIQVEIADLMSSYLQQRRD
ncbi:MAG: hypothetical protein WB471_05335 [Nocardioides sp.]